MKKFFRLLSIVLALVITLSLSTLLPAEKVNADSEDKPKERYTVLVLDTSGSMYGKPIEGAKKALQKFCNDVKTADGNNHVAFVVFDDNAITRFGFDFDEDKMQRYIGSTSTGGQTNYSAALKLAGGLLDAVDKDCIKNIIFCSDGCPNEGEYTYRGHYSSAYPYANAAYDIASSLKRKANIYTIGFFHGLLEEHKPFARRLLSDMASTSAMYYEVIDPDEISFIFDGVLKDMYVSDNDPIILIPGIMGSKLYLEKDCNSCVWPEVEAIDVKDCIQNETLYVKPPAIQNKLYSTRDYGAQNCMEDLVNYMCKQFPDRDVYVFNYDWRKSNRESAKSLHEFIDSLDTDSVDIVAHSMGGIVTSAYFADYNGAKVDKVITCGTPYEGAPHCIEAIADWSVANNNFYDIILGIKGLTKSIKSQFSGVAELVPTKNYVSKYPMWQDHRKSSTDYDYKITDFDEYQKSLSKIFGSDIC